MTDFNSSTEDTLIVPTKPELRIEDILVLRLPNGEELKLDATYNIDHIPEEYRELVVHLLGVVARNSIAVPWSLMPPSVLRPSPAPAPAPSVTESSRTHTRKWLRISLAMCVVTLLVIWLVSP